MGNGCCLANFKGLKCNACKKWFNNKECFLRHLKIVCKMYHFCELCEHSYSVSKGHECFATYCHLCTRKHLKSERCFIQVLKKQTTQKRIIVFDLEV